MQKSGRRHGNMDPELDKCRTRGVGAVMPGTKLEMFYCKIENADCRYAMPFGYDYVCKHSNNFAFAIPEDHGAAHFPSQSSSRF